MRFPSKIKRGDTIGVVAPSGPFTKYSLETIEKSLNEYGYNVKFGKSCVGSYKGYLSASDEIRAKDIENMFSDTSVNGILCIRGGYGTPRILDMIDYNIIKENPKLFIGFSDITALHIAFNQEANLVTLHGPMAGTSPDWDEFTYESLNDIINMEHKLEVVNPKGENINTIVDGECEGILIGGNLALLVATIGTKYEIDTKGKVLFIEDIGEDIYRIDRMLTQLALSNKFEDCEGIIFGDFCDCNNSSEEEFKLEELFKDRVGKYKKPCISNLKSGHCMPMITLPLGVKCKLDATNRKIEIKK